MACVVGVVALTSCGVGARTLSGDEVAEYAETSVVQLGGERPEIECDEGMIALLRQSTTCRLTPADGGPTVDATVTVFAIAGNDVRMTVEYPGQEQGTAGT
ncbi:hypothetical protein GCM10025865_08850 [Paraoerskovia sediminicola]|uniref:DUF4333 domain-containing protein n=1 Tax=Paraoerskovia sediminicola TaxID=1138587 RepID=A0ABM8G0Q6_9CELL|nr:hypothetical protein GCM10025865_08850 [Paraoerskovia sediminicola]